MKNPILYITLFVAVFAQGQSDNQQLTSDFQKYSNALKSRQYTQATSYMPEALFDIYDKEDLVQEMKQTFESSDTKVNINAVEISQIGEKMSVDGDGSYIPFTFNQKFDIQYVNLFDATDDEQSRDSTTKFIVDMLNESIPESVIKFDKKQEVFKVDSIKKAVAIKSSTDNSWKFLIFEPSLKNSLEQLLPAAVIQKMKL